MSRSTFRQMTPDHNEERLRQLAIAWVEGEMTTYLKAYTEVMAQLEKENGMSLLVTVVNTMLDRMLKEKITAYQAANMMMAEMRSLRSRFFVMAAAVDILLNERVAGEKVKALPTMQETLGRVSA